ncbi:MAG: DUF2934 domain-containing protein [Myxococcales bacterium]
MAAKNETRGSSKPPVKESPTESRRGAQQERTAPLDRDVIARRAYERYEKRGKTPGRDQEDWFDAERELKGGGHAGGRQA